MNRRKFINACSGILLGIAFDLGVRVDSVKGLGSRRTAIECRNFLAAQIVSLQKAGKTLWIQRYRDEYDSLKMMPYIEGPPPKIT